MLLEQHRCEDPLASESATRGLNFPEITHEPNNTNSLATLTWGFLKSKPPEKKMLAFLGNPKWGPLGGCAAV